MLKLQKVDATRGNIPRLIMIYVIPLILSSLVQKLFNAVDITVLGNMASSEAVAAVGATTSIIHLLVDSFLGLSNGTKVILARYFGARDKKKINQTVNTSILTAVGLGLFITLVGLFLAPILLEVTHCPADCFEGALLYMRIYICAAPAILLYNFGSSVLTAGNLRVL